jgi:hypothetical protein
LIGSRTPLFEEIEDVVFDTCVHFPPTLRDVVVQLALNGCINIRIPTIVLYELERVLSLKGGLDDVASRRAVKKLSQAFLRPVDIQPMLPGDEGILEYCKLNDIRLLVTENTKDFPATPRLRVVTLGQYLLALDTEGLGCLGNATSLLATRYRNPAKTHEEILDRLEKLGIVGVRDFISNQSANQPNGAQSSELHPHR